MAAQKETVVVVTLALLGCIRGPMQRATPMTEERVVTSDACLDIAYCRNFSPFYRPGTDPQIGVVKWLVSNQGHACIVSDEDFVRAVPGAMWNCASGWRFRRA